jgi:hypothetical protein
VHRIRPPSSHPLPVPAFSLPHWCSTMGMMATVKYALWQGGFHYAYPKHRGSFKPLWSVEARPLPNCETNKTLVKKQWIPKCHLERKILPHEEWMQVWMNRHEPVYSMTEWWKVSIALFFLTFQLLFTFPQTEQFKVWMAQLSLLGRRYHHWLVCALHRYESPENHVILLQHKPQLITLMYPRILHQSTFR